MILVIFALAGCRENPVIIQDNAALFQAKVIDSNNNPIVSVGFQYVFYVGANVVSKNYQFRYGLHAADTITMSIFDPFENQIAMPLNKMPQFPGSYSYNYDATGLPNGVYSCTIAGSTINQRTNFFVLTDDIAQLTVTKPLITSDANGIIQLSYASLGIGDHFLYQNGSALLELTIADSISILLTKQGYKDYLQVIKLDTTKFFGTTVRLLAN